MHEAGVTDSWGWGKLDGRVIMPFTTQHSSKKLSIGGSTTHAIIHTLPSWRGTSMHHSTVFSGLPARNRFVNWDVSRVLLLLRSSRVQGAPRDPTKKSHLPFWQAATIFLLHRNGPGLCESISTDPIKEPAIG